MNKRQTEKKYHVLEDSNRGSNGIILFETDSRENAFAFSKEHESKDCNVALVQRNPAYTAK